MGGERFRHRWGSHGKYQGEKPKMVPRNLYRRRRVTWKIYYALCDLVPEGGL